MGKRLGNLGPVRIYWGAISLLEVVDCSRYRLLLHLDDVRAIVSLGIWYIERLREGHRSCKGSRMPY